MWICEKVLRSSTEYFSVDPYRLAWAFWAAPVEEVFKTPAAIVELNQMVDTIEATKNVKFTEGFNPNVDCIRLNLDPVIASHRPLIYYSVRKP